MEMVDEVCPHCGLENEIPDDIISICSRCGQNMLPCKGCVCWEEQEGCDWEEGGCHKFTDKGLISPAIKGDYDKFIGKRTDEELISELKELNEPLFSYFGDDSGKNIHYGWICHALEERGYDVYPDEELTIQKKEEEKC